MGVTPGRYWVHVPWVQGGYISALSSGATDLTREPLVIGTRQHGIANRSDRPQRRRHDRLHSSTTFRSADAQNSGFDNRLKFPDMA